MWPLSVADSEMPVPAVAVGSLPGTLFVSKGKLSVGSGMISTSAKKTQGMIDSVLRQNPPVSIQEISQPETPCYEFIGFHLLASLSGCDKDAIANHDELLQAMKTAVEAAGATVLQVATQVFPNNALTAVVLLSESHASIHTYPEYNSCFIDIFTCGTACRPEEYFQSLCRYFCPEKIDKQLVVRGTPNE